MATRDRCTLAVSVQNGAELGAPGDDYNKSPCREGRSRLLKDKTHRPTTPSGIFSPHRGAHAVSTHGLLEKQVFSFHLYYFSFYLRFRLVTKLVFLYFNVNVYLMEIPCLNKVTLPYLTLPYLTLPYLTLPYLTLPYLTLPYLTLPYLTLPYLTLPYLTLPYLTLPYLTLPYLTLPYLTLPYLTLPYIGVCHVSIHIRVNQHRT